MRGQSMKAQRYLEANRYHEFESLAVGGVRAVPDGATCSKRCGDQDCYILARDPATAWRGLRVMWARNLSPHSIGPSNASLGAHRHGSACAQGQGAKPCGREPRVCARLQPCETRILDALSYRQNGPTSLYLFSCVAVCWPHLSGSA